jgi:hypothetical protein
MATSTRLLIALLDRAKFINFCGQPGARLDPDQRLYEDAPGSRSRGVFLGVINIVLFGSPEAYSKALRSIWVDDMPIRQQWQYFMDKLSTQWNGYFGFFVSGTLS